MTKNPKDLDVWLDFIDQLNKQKSTQRPYKSREINLLKDQFTSQGSQVNSEEWNKLIQRMDWVNHKRDQYIAKQSSTPIKEKTVIFSLPASECFTLPVNIEETVLSLDRIDKKYLKKLGLHHIAVVDLHGYTLRLAYERLKTAFQSAQQQKAKILKVITGKGRANPESENPTLRQIFPQWMKEIYFQSFLIKVRKAPIEEGGDGAFLVYLKQPK